MGPCLRTKKALFLPLFAQMLHMGAVRRPGEWQGGLRFGQADAQA